MSRSWCEVVFHGSPSPDWRRKGVSTKRSGWGRRTSFWRDFGRALPPGKWKEHRGFGLYGQGNVYNARNRIIIGVRNVLVLTSRWTMMDDDMSIISSKISYESVHGQFGPFVFFSKLARKKTEF